MARHSEYTDEIATKICQLIVDGQSLRKICQSDDMPSATTVHKWLCNHSKFAEQYARARIDQADTLADEMVHIADTEPDANRARVRIDARKWVASKLKPKKYGERLDLNVTPNQMTEDEINARIERIVERNRKAVTALPKLEQGHES
jgi:hypothetical protein